MVYPVDRRSWKKYLGPLHGHWGCFDTSQFKRKNRINKLLTGLPGLGKAGSYRKGGERGSGQHVKKRCNMGRKIEDKEKRYVRGGR